MLKSFLLICLFMLPLGAAAQDVRFEHFSLEQGLSQSTPNCILQDRHGYLWIGTEDGLNRYDGYGFSVYRHDPQDSLSISGNLIRSLYEDRSGSLWIGTQGGGLDKFNPTTKTFEHFTNDPKNPNSLSNNTVYSIYEDRSGSLWIGTLGGGLNKFDYTIKSFEHFTSEPNNSNSLSNNRVSSIYEDRSGLLWIGTADGLNKFDPITKTFEHFTSEPNNPNSLSNNTIRVIYGDRSGSLWIGTQGGGLDKFNPATKTFEHFTNDPKNLYSLSNNNVISIYEDRSGLLWLGTYNGGLNKFNPTTKTFEHFTSDPNNPRSLSNVMVGSIYEDRSGSLWVGTYGGLNRFDPKTKTFEHFTNDPNNPRSLGDYNNAVSIHQDQSGSFWVGMDGGGLNRFDPKTKTFEHFTNDPNNPHSLSGNSVESILQDRSGSLWIGTYGGGLNKFNPVTKTFEHFTSEPNNPNSLSNNFIWSVYEDRSGLLWVCTQGGLNKFDPKTKTFERFTNDPKNPQSLSNNSVFAIYEDQSGKFWLGTFGGGLNKFDPSTKSFTTFTIKDGLPNDCVYGILEDSQGNLWFSTNKGLCKFNPKTFACRNYDITDGLQSNEFNSGAYYKGRDGKFYFGGVNGFNAFYPDSIKDNPFIPPIVITDFKIFDKSVKRDIDSSGIVLAYQQNFFSFEFAALNFITPEKNQYAYKLEGFDKDWITSGSRRYASYTNLEPGNYVFRAKGSNNDGVWNEAGLSVKVVITPPWWATWWFRSFATASVLGMAFAGYRKRVRDIEAQNKILEKKVEVRTEQLQSANIELAEFKRNITSSIEYAQTIQQAILPYPERLALSFSEYFILFKPQAIVSGDFYWLHETEDAVIFAVCDCTGHGVPGAFMSMIGDALLNQIVIEKEIHDPAAILTQLHQDIRYALKQTEEDKTNEDGMDVCLVRIEKEKLIFAGAKRPLYVVTQGILTEVKGDKFGIGGRERGIARNFTNHDVAIETGMMIYLTSDGYADQADEQRQAIGTKRMKEILTSLVGQTSHEQKQSLENLITKHQGKSEQRDDITVVGIRMTER